jgi:hypothetical protein
MMMMVASFAMSRGAIEALLPDLAGIPSPYRTGRLPTRRSAFRLPR